MARTQQWIANQKLKFFRQVLYDNNISLMDMHDILEWYFNREARYDAAEDSVWPLTGEHNASRQPPLYSVVNPETLNKGAPMMSRGVLNAKVISMPDSSTDPAAKPNEDEFEEVEVEELVPLPKQTRRL